MVATLYDVPGFREKWEAELENLLIGREAAWLDVPYKIGRFEIQPLTLGGLIDLNASGNSFIAGGVHTYGDIIAFIWRCDKAYAPLHKLGFRGQFRRFRLQRKARKLWMKDQLVPEMEDLRDYFAGIRKEENITTKKRGKGRGLGESVASLAAYRVHNMATEYGWKIKDVMGTPVAQMNQLASVSSLVNDPDAKGIAPLRELRNWGLQELNRLQAEESEKTDG